MTPKTDAKICGMGHSSRGCSTWTSCAARTRTRRSSRSTPTADRGPDGELAGDSFARDYHMKIELDAKKDGTMTGTGKRGGAGDPYRAGRNPGRRGGRNLPSLKEERVPMNWNFRLSHISARLRPCSRSA